VVFFERTPASTWERREARARLIVSAAGAVESARLLLNSSSARHPNGIGNEHGLVGRNLQGHVYAGAFGLHPDELYENRGPGPSVATNRWNHGNEGLVGGGMLADDFLKPPIDFWRSALGPQTPRWGAENKAYTRRNFRRTLQIVGPVQDIPCPDARVQVDEKQRDFWGVPVARLSGTTHPETVRVADFMRRRAEEWLRASGCHTVWSHTPSLHLSGGQHQAGTCRMGRDPKTSVCDDLGRIHGHDNVFVVDGSLHVTNGGFNPFLTLMSLSLRCSESIVAAR
jgi:choline dehydrogenase-like flavoprotein